VRDVQRVEHRIPQKYPIKLLDKQTHFLNNQQYHPENSFFPILTTALGTIILNV